MHHHYVTPVCDETLVFSNVSYTSEFVDTVAFDA